MGRPKKIQNLKGQWQCAECGEWKDPEEYYKRSASANGLMSKCKTCSNATMRAYHARMKLRTIGNDLLSQYPQLSADEALEMARIVMTRDLYVDSGDQTALKSAQARVDDMFADLYRDYGPPIITGYQKKDRAPSWTGKEPKDMTDAEYADWWAYTRRKLHADEAS